VQVRRVSEPSRKVWHLLYGHRRSKFWRQQRSEGKPVVQTVKDMMEAANAVVARVSVAEAQVNKFR